MRLFVAIPIPTPERQKVVELCRALRGIKGKFVEPENLHLTVAFLGEAPETLLPGIRRTLQQTARSMSGSALRLERVVGIPRVRPRLLALEVTVPPWWLSLQQATLAGLTKLGVSAKGFEPHLTLVRLRAPLGHIPKIPWTPQAFVADQIVLFQSVLQAKGPVYTPLQAFKLAPGGPQTPLRPNIAICVLNPKNEVLLVSARGRRGDWQFPQGGVEPGESLAAALTRELKEEVGISRFQTLLLKSNVYHYHWTAAFIKHSKVGGSKGHHVGQEQSLGIIRIPEERPRLKPDVVEAARCKWVPVPDVLRELGTMRRDIGRIAVVELRQLGLIT